MRATYTVPFAVDVMVPAVGQGALAIETRIGATVAADLDHVVGDPATDIAVTRRARLPAHPARRLPGPGRGARRRRRRHAAPGARRSPRPTAAPSSAASGASRPRSTRPRRPEQSSRTNCSRPAARPPCRKRTVPAGRCTGGSFYCRRTQERPSRIAPALRDAGAEVIEAADSAAARAALAATHPRRDLVPVVGLGEAITEYLAGLRENGDRPVVAAMGPSSSERAGAQRIAPDVVAPNAEVASFVQTVTRHVLERTLDERRGIAAHPCPDERSRPRPRRLRVERGDARDGARDARQPRRPRAAALHRRRQRRAHRPISSMPGIARLSVDARRRGVPRARRARRPRGPAVRHPRRQGRGRDLATTIPTASCRRAIRAIKAALPADAGRSPTCATASTPITATAASSTRAATSTTTDARAAGAHRDDVCAAPASTSIAPSDMMDGRVGAIRSALDADGFTNIAIMSYAAKYASAFYGPFREAADSTPQFGDRRTYQMDPANAREALREVRARHRRRRRHRDGQAGARVHGSDPRGARRSSTCPVACYNVSGEYAMVKAAAERGWIDEERIVDEMLVGFARAGADIIITYFAKDYAQPPPVIDAGVVDPGGRRSDALPGQTRARRRRRADDRARVPQRLAPAARRTFRARARSRAAIDTMLPCPMVVDAGRCAGRSPGC